MFSFQSGIKVFNPVHCFNCIANKVVNKCLFDNKIIKETSYRLICTSNLLRDYVDRKGITERVEVKELWKVMKNNPRLMIDGYKIFKQELGKLKEELKVPSIYNAEYLKNIKMAETIKLVFPFETEEDFKNFVVSTDSDFNTGYTKANFVFTENKTALLTGNLSTAIPSNCNISRTGFVNITSRRKVKAFLRFGYLDWSGYTHLVLKVRGDGRSWFMLLSTPYKYQETFNHKFCHPLYTRGGPYWQLTKIPFNHFFFSTQNLISQTHMEAPVLNKIANFGITLSDNRDGPFYLEIDYIGLAFDEKHKNTIIYETYHT